MRRSDLMVMAVCVVLGAGCSDGGAASVDAANQSSDALSATGDDAVGEVFAQGEEDATISVDDDDASLVARGDASPVEPDVTVPGDPGALGDYPVGHLEVTIQDPDDPARKLPTQVWYPAADFDSDALSTYVIGAMGPFELEYPSATAQREVTAASGAFPFVIFSHGYGGISTQSLDLCERLASHGFIVASPAHTGNTAEDDFDETSVPREEAAADRPRDVRTLIDTFTSEDSVPELLLGHVDGSRVGVTGHSFGGYTALSAAAGHDASEMAPDDRVGAIAPICPDSSEFTDAELEAVTIPVLFVGGTLDTSTPIEPQITRPYALMGSEVRLRVDVVGATHTHFANICTIGQALIDMGLTPDMWEGVGAGALLNIYEETCGEAAFPIAEAIRIQTHYVVAFFKVHLSDEPSWAGLLTPGYASTCEPDIALFSEGVADGAAVPPCVTDADEPSP